MAIVGLASQEIVAVALGDGSVVWRRANAGRPIAASPSHLLSFVAQGYELRSMADGELIARLIEAGLPDPEDLTEVNVGDTPEGPAIAWTGLSRHRGGAVPPFSRAAPTPRSQAIVLDLAKGDVKPATAPVECQPENTPVMLSLAGAVLEAREISGTLRWATPLGGAPRSRPTPLPQ